MNVELKPYYKFKSENIRSGYLSEKETIEVYTRYALRKVRDMIEDDCILVSGGEFGDFWNVRDKSNEILSLCIGQIKLDNL